MMWETGSQPEKGTKVKWEKPIRRCNGRCLLKIVICCVSYAFQNWSIWNLIFLGRCALTESSLYCNFRTLRHSLFSIISDSRVQFTGFLWCIWSWFQDFPGFPTISCHGGWAVSCPLSVNLHIFPMGSRLIDFPCQSYNWKAGIKKSGYCYWHNEILCFCCCWSEQRWNKEFPMKGQINCCLIL